jgi:hypothetical protein
MPVLNKIYSENKYEKENHVYCTDYKIMNTNKNIQLNMQFRNYSHRMWVHDILTFYNILNDQMLVRPILRDVQEMLWKSKKHYTEFCTLFNAEITDPLCNIKIFSLSLVCNFYYTYPPYILLNSVFKSNVPGWKLNCGFTAPIPGSYTFKFQSKATM